MIGFQPAAAPQFGLADDLLVGGGECALPRAIGGQNSAGYTSGVLTLVFFTARRTEVIGNLRMGSGAVASASLTLGKMGVYTVDTSTGDLTRVGITTNDTALFGALNTVYTKALTSSFTKVKGTRYAAGFLCIGTTMPNVIGTATLTAPGSTWANERNRVLAQLTGQTDIPASITSASLTAATRFPQIALLP